MKTPRRIYFSVVIISILAIIFTLNGCKDNKEEQTSSNPKVLIEKKEVVIDSIVLSSELPFDVVITGNDMSTSIRRNFDQFSWESFIALNWPEDSAQTIGMNGDNDTHWESWKNVADIFLENGAKPKPWGAPGTIPSACPNNQNKMLSQIGKTPDLLNESMQPFKTGPLIDQNGVYSRFEILLNKEMFEYIDENKLYSFDGQQEFNQEAVFPEGTIKKKEWGATMVKASWKILGENDDPSRFHTVEAVIYTPPQDDPKTEESCFTAKVGLVGLHIGTKTEISPQWIWSTFEQVDNVPTFGESQKKDHYNYFNANSDSPINEVPSRPWNASLNNQTPTQVVRLTPIYSGTAELNAAYQTKLREVNEKSVWQYYELVGTQWPTDPTDMPLGDPFPQFLGNATLETYILGVIERDSVKLVPNVSTSCMHCHNGATMTANGKASDFTFILERAN